MILLDNTYFTGEISLPNIPVTAPEGDPLELDVLLQTIGEKNLTWFGDKYTVEFLIQLLGKDTAKKFLAEIQKPSPDAIWIALKNHLLLEFGSFKVSPIANYVYYWLMRDAMTKTTVAGEAREEFDCADNANAGRKLVRAWNEMVDLSLEFLEWFIANYNDYREYAGELADFIGYIQTGWRLFHRKHEYSILEKINDWNL